MPFVMYSLLLVHSIVAFVADMVFVNVVSL